MPQIIVKNIREEDCAPLAASAFPAIAKACSIPADWLMLDVAPARFYAVDGPLHEAPVVVQVWWFARPKEMQDTVAALLHEALAALGYGETQISFHVFPRETFYENGKNT